MAFLPVLSAVAGTWSRPPESWAKLPLALHMGHCMVLFKANQGIPVAGQQCVHPTLPVIGAGAGHGGGVARVWGCQCCLGSQSVLLASEDDFLVLGTVSSNVTIPSPPLQCRTLTGMVCSCSACSTVGFSGSYPLQGPGGTCVIMQVSDAQSLGSALLQMVLGYSIFGATERWHEERPFSKAATAQIWKWLKAQEWKYLQPCWESLSQETPSSPGCGTGW